MNTKHFLSVSLLLLVLTTTVAQQPPATVPATQKSGEAASPNAFIKFDLDFPGGRPKDLIAAIQKASGHALTPSCRMSGPIRHCLRSK